MLAGHFVSVIQTVVDVYHTIVKNIVKFSYNMRLFSLVIDRVLQGGSVMGIAIMLGKNPDTMG